MSTGEYKARALYDFDAETSDELSFSAGEILTVISASSDNPWW